MTSRTTRGALTACTLTAATAAASLLSAVPASAGGVGAFLSPAFGTECSNHNAGALAGNATRSGTGTAGGNLVGLPVGSPINQCGGADVPGLQRLSRVGMMPLQETQGVLKTFYEGV
jgi:hypothetical protein